MPYQLTITNIQEAITAAALNVTTSIVNYLPNIVGAVVLLAVGLIIGKWVKALVKKVLELVNVSSLVKDSGIQNFLDKAEVKTKIEEGSGEVLRWLILLVFFIAAVNLLGLTTVSAFLNAILGYIPQVISASLVFAAGVLIAGWVEGLVKGAVGSLSLGTGRLLGKIASYVVVVFTILAAIGELGIAAEFINILFIGFVTMLALGLGLAFGLGAKDVVAEMLKEWHRQMKKELK